MSTKYIVTVEVFYVADIEVEANNKFEAEKAAANESLSDIYNAAYTETIRVTHIEEA